MRKLFLSSTALALFAISITIFQISCQKDASAQTTSNYTLPPATTSTLGGIIVGNGLTVTSNGTLSVNATTGSLLQKIIFTKIFQIGGNQFGEIWTANYDGAGQLKVNINFPAGHIFEGAEDPVRISPNGQKIFFELFETAISKTHLFSCSIDGTNVTKIIDGTGTNLKSISIQGAY